MFCNNCGKEVNEQQMFCENCGAKQEVFIAMPVQTKAKSINIWVIIAAALMALGTLLPCYSVSFFGMSESMSYIEGDGVIIMIAAVAAAVLAIFKKEKFACIPAAISVILLIYLCSEISKVGMGTIGIGMYFMWLGSIATGVLPFIKFKK